MPCNFDNIERALWPALRETQGNAMAKLKRNIIEVQGASIALVPEVQQDVIRLTDIAKFGSGNESTTSELIPLNSRELETTPAVTAFSCRPGNGSDLPEAKDPIASTGRYGGTRGFQKRMSCRLASSFLSEENHCV